MEFTTIIVVASAIIGAAIIYAIITHGAGEPEHAEEDPRLSKPVQVMDPLADEPLDEDNGEEIIIVTSGDPVAIRVNPSTAAKYRAQGLKPFRRNLARLTHRRSYYCYFDGKVDLELLEYCALHNLMFEVGMDFEPPLASERHAATAVEPSSPEDTWFKGGGGLSGGGHNAGHTVDLGEEHLSVQHEIPTRTLEPISTTPSWGGGDIGSGGDCGGRD